MRVFETAERPPKAAKTIHEERTLNSQCLKRRIASFDLMRREVSAWQRHRYQRGAPVHWRFTTEDARLGYIQNFRRYGILVFGVDQLNTGICEPNRSRCAPEEHPELHVISLGWDGGFAFDVEPVKSV